MTRPPTMKERRSHFAFAVWAMQQPKPPTIAQVRDLTGLSYESARRWRNDWCAALSPATRQDKPHGNTDQ